MPIVESYKGYEVITIPDDESYWTKWRYVESDWMVIVDEPSKTAVAYNRKTGEARPYPYSDAVKVFHE